jgi:hypothetical protein
LANCSLLMKVAEATPGKVMVRAARPAAQGQLSESNRPAQNLPLT